MSGFRIEPEKVSALAEELNGYSGDLSKISQEVGKVRRADGISTSSYSAVQWRIKSLTEKLENEKDKMGNLYTSLQTIHKSYIDCEAAVTGNAQGKKPEEIPPAGQGDGSEPEKKPWYADIPKESLKTVLDIIGEAGNTGTELSLLTAIAKVLIDHDGLTPEDVGNVLKGMGNSIIGLIQDDNSIDPEDLKKALGLGAFETIKTDASASWFQNMGITWKETFKDQLSVTKDAAGTGAKVANGVKIAGWTLSLLANGFSNYEEYSKGEISGGRAVAETVVETGVDIVKGAAITAGVAAGIAALGISAPAVVVAGTAVAVSAILDYGSKQIFGKGVTELVSDAIVDGGEMLVNGVKQAASSIGNAVKDTFTGAVKSIGNIMPKWKWSFG